MSSTPSPIFQRFLDRGVRPRTLVAATGISIFLATFGLSVLIGDLLYSHVFFTGAGGRFTFWDIFGEIVLILFILIILGILSLTFGEHIARNIPER